jgi:hypothetical protein
MAITFAAFHSVVDHVAKTGHPVMLRARHGVGKSTVVYDYAKTVNLPVIERRASQMTEGDLLGLPKLNENKTDWIPPAWLKRACDEPVVLFIDEIDRATTEVRQGFFELCDSRKIAGWHLHENTLIFSAINGGEHGAQYQVGEMDPAELDRWTVFDLEPSVEDWLSWAKENVHRIIVDFIRDNPKHLEHTTDFEPNKVYPSRRSWHRLSNTLSSANLIVAGETSAALFNIATAYIGFEGAVSFQDYVKKCQKDVQPKDIIDDAEFNLTKNFDINQHSALVDKINDEGWLTRKLSQKQIKNLATYFKSLPSEIAMVLEGHIVANASKKESMETLLSFHELVKDYLIEIIAGKEEEKE